MDIQKGINKKGEKMAAWYQFLGNHNPSCEEKQNEDSMPERLDHGYRHDCLTLEGNTNTSVFKTEFLQKLSGRLERQAVLR